MSSRAVSFRYPQLVELRLIHRDEKVCEQTALGTLPLNALLEVCIAKTSWDGTPETFPTIVETSAAIDEIKSQ